jgi:hypothetical protein
MSVCQKTAAELHRLGGGGGGGTLASICYIVAVFCGQARLCCRHGRLDWTRHRNSSRRVTARQIRIARYIHFVCGGGDASPPNCGPLSACVVCPSVQDLNRENHPDNQRLSCDLCRLVCDDEALGVSLWPTSPGESTQKLIRIAIGDSDRS